MANPNPSPENRFKPGKSGNPNGRPPKGYSITEMMREMLASKPEIKEAIGKAIAKKALQGDLAAAKMLWQYMDGMPQQKVDMNGSSITVSIENYDDKHKPSRKTKRGPKDS